jgi:hypothetical protein
MILCNHCAGRVDPDSLVCTECGEAVLRQQQQQQPPPPASTGAAIASGAATKPLERVRAHVEAPEPLATRRHNAKARTGRRWAAVVVGVALCVLVATALGVVVNRERERERLAREPFVVEKIELRNVDATERWLSSATNSFPRKDIRYVQFYLTLRNNAYGIQDYSGQIEVDYITPDGALDSTPDSPFGHTLTQQFSISSTEETKVVTHGWGSATKPTFAVGKWKVVFWWQGRQVGEASFNVY